ncbi:hypothetical protein FISHEDRAFT_78937 [Fistulina hepatica ATCC 64428]|uniref:Uncharacterized protein n=1 Tax=Fistulina hepatica ATCC 64428 TaxID=1128425 RepID=A0A0D6ZYT9_9AGAR|nr:hypothetical protein FISHEDRAFT_78937 [Fistulina hepatica ATCC 64428]
MLARMNVAFDILAWIVATFSAQTTSEARRVFHKRPIDGVQVACLRELIESSNSFALEASNGATWQKAGGTAKSPLGVVVGNARLTAFTKEKPPGMSPRRGRFPAIARRPTIMRSHLYARAQTCLASARSEARSPDGRRT